MAELGKMRDFSVEELEQALGQYKIEHYVRSCEAAFLKSLAEIAYDTAWNPTIKAIFISGPTSSGKTTFARRLASALHLHGRPSCSLSFDDYYRDRLQPRFIDGRPDLESIDTLDVRLLVEHIKRLLKGERVVAPRFDFMTRRRVDDAEHLFWMPPRGVLLIEGLHGLSEEISGTLKEGEYLNVFIMPYADVFSDQRLFGPREIRVFRRLCRDAHHRNTTALTTLDYWPLLDYAEERIFPQYIARAHVFLNSAMGYEFCVIPSQAQALLERDIVAAEQGTLAPPTMVREVREYVDLPTALAFARKLLKICRKLPSVSADIVPENSILTEFIH